MENMAFFNINVLYLLQIYELIKSWPVIGLNSIYLEIAIRLHYNKICKGLSNKL